ncbi:MAG: glycosyltransferase [Candidatus Hinthialibacter antarcticus]|nr:glycosyltransferase [Candidatus Hinthialibacter antarcticus]
MRILALNYEFPPIGGGGGSAHRNLIQEWAAMDDVELTLIAPSVETQTVDLSERARLLLYAFPKRDMRYWRRGEVLRFLWRFHQLVRAHLREHSYDLIHAFFGFPTGLLAYRLCGDTPYIVSVRGSDVPGYNQRFGLDYIVLKPLLQRIYSNAAAVVANSDGLKHLYENAFPHLSASVIPNGIDMDAFHPVEREWDGPLSLISVGRMIPRKGFDVLLRACAVLHQDKIPFQSHLVGDGPEEANLKTLADELGVSDRVIFHGGLTREQIAALLPRCHAFVLPSYAEGMANAALEAMACGLPLLLTDVGGSRELIDGNGAIVPCGEVGALAEHLRNWLSAPNLLEQMGRRSRERAQHFSWNAAAQMYRDLYLQVLDSQKEK